MRGCCIVLILFAFLVEGVFGETDEETATAGHPFILKSDVTKQQHDTVKWYFNDILIAQINGDPSTSCPYEGEGGRFRDSLMSHYETGSLIITDIRPEHAGRYEAQFFNTSSGKSESLNRKCDGTKIIPKKSDSFQTIKSFRLTVIDSCVSPAVPDSCVPPAAVVGIVVGVVALVVALAVVGVMIYLRRSSRNDEKKIPPWLLEKSKDEVEKSESRMA